MNRVYVVGIVRSGKQSDRRGERSAECLRYNHRIYGVCRSGERAVSRERISDHADEAGSEAVQDAFEEAMKGKKVAMICSGDAGVYGMAGLMYEVGVEFPKAELEIVPGITAAIGGAAVLGAPLIHDFAVIS